MRHRLEDLGRLALMVHHLLDDEIFDELNCPRRPKDYEDWWMSMTEEQRDDMLVKWIYGIERIRLYLYEILEVAEGTDILNLPSM